MDVSLEYLKMCEKAEEIQKGDMVNGDYFAIVGSEDAEFDGVHIYDEGEKF